MKLSRFICFAAISLLALTTNLAVQAQDPTLDAAIVQATSRAQATRAAGQQTVQAVSVQRTAEAISLTRAADATRQALDTQARQQAIALTGTALAHRESLDATATAVWLEGRQQDVAATATAQTLHTLAMRRSLDEQAAAGAGVLLLSVAIAAMVALVGLGAYRFLRARSTPVPAGPVAVISPPEAAGDEPEPVPPTVVVDASQPGAARTVITAIAHALGDELP